MGDEPRRKCGKRVTHAAQATCRDAIKGGGSLSPLQTDIEVVRSEAKGEQRTQQWRVPYETGQTVLDALRWIREHADPSLGFRYSCINANACKECMMLIDGEVQYACLARLEPRAMRIEPLPKKRLIRDLITEISPGDERLGD